MKAATATTIIVESRHSVGIPTNDTYEVEGIILPDGRLLTVGTGTDGRDSLWESLEDFEPNGFDHVRRVVHGDPCDPPSPIEIWGADLDNRVYGCTLCTTAEQAAGIADEADLDLDECEVTEVNGVVTVVEPGWWADNGDQPVEYDYVDNNAEAARAYVDDGDWGDPVTATEWIQIETWRRGWQAGGHGIVEVRVDEGSHQVALEPPEPDCCCPTGHEWASPPRVVGGCSANPGVRLHGGGVVSTDVCRWCGTYRVCDSWAQDRQTGEQGLDSVEYRDADEASLEWVLAQRLDVDELLSRCGSCDPDEIQRWVEEASGFPEELHREVVEALLGARPTCED